MVCIHCGSETRVINSRPQKRINQVWRRRQCLKCQTIFSTSEAAQYESVWLARDKKGKLAPFSRDKLFLSLYRSCQHRSSATNDAGALSETIIAKLLGTAQSGLIEAKDIIIIAHVALNRFDQAAATHYQAFHKSRNKIGS